MTPILQPDAIRRLAWIKAGPIKCVKDFPVEQPFFLAGREYHVEPKSLKVQWKDNRKTSLGNVENIRFTGIESAFIIKNEQQVDCWFTEKRLGREVAMTPIAPNEYSFQELIEHFEIPAVDDLSTTRKAEYEAARERIKCLTIQGK